MGSPKSIHIGDLMHPMAPPFMRSVSEECASVDNFENGAPIEEKILPTVNEGNR